MRSMPVNSLLACRFATGIDIGQIQTLELITARNEVQAKAVLYPEYVQTFARSGTRFSVITPQISAAGVEHLDTILQPYINVEPGRGNPRRDFELQEATITDSRYLDGLSIVVEAPEAGSLNIGTPVLFRGIEVGTVTGLTLGSLSDRVMVAMRISQRYQHLVRNNSVFWLASGYNLDFGLTGGVVKTGTFNQFIRGGIAFATPPVHRWLLKRRQVNTSCCSKANRKSGVNGEQPCHDNLSTCSGVLAPEHLCYTAHLFFCRWYQVAYFPDAFLTKMREAMPSTLSFDDFLAACQRPLRRSIRVNTLKISVADFLTLTAPYNWSLTPVPGVLKVSGSNAMKKSQCRSVAQQNI